MWYCLLQKPNQFIRNIVISNKYSESCSTLLIRAACYQNRFKKVIYLKGEALDKYQSSDNTMAIWKLTKAQRVIHKTLHRKLKIKQQSAHSLICKKNALCMSSHLLFRSVLSAMMSAKKKCSIPLDLYLFCGGFMLYLCYLYLFTYTGVQHDFHIRRCSCPLAVTRGVSHVEQEMLTLPEYLTSPSVLVRSVWLDFLFYV